MQHIETLSHTHTHAQQENDKNDAQAPESERNKMLDKLAKQNFIAAMRGIPRYYAGIKQSLVGA